MIRKGFLLLALAAFLVVPSPATAQDEITKIAVVDLDQALNTIEEGKAAREELSRKQREAEGKVKPDIELFQKLQEELKSKKFVLSEEALYQRQLDLVELKNKIESDMKELEGKLKVFVDHLPYEGTHPDLVQPLEQECCVGLVRPLEVLDPLAEFEG